MLKLPTPPSKRPFQKNLVRTIDSRRARNCKLLICRHVQLQMYAVPAIPTHAMVTASAPARHVATEADICVVCTGSRAQVNLLPTAVVERRIRPGRVIANMKLPRASPG